MTLIGTLLAVWTRWVVRFAWPVIAVVIVLAGLGVHYMAGHLGINTDTANMISSELEWRRDFNDYRDRFPQRDRNVIVLVDAPDPAVAERFARRLAERIRAEPELFDSVFLAGSGEFFERNGLLYLSVADLEALADRLADAQPLLGLIRRDPSAAGLLDVVTRIVTESDSTLTTESLERFYAAVARGLDAVAAGGSDPIDWRALIRSDTGNTTESPLLVVQPKLDFTRIRPARPAIERLRSLEIELSTEIGQPVSMQLTGTLAMEDEELDSVTQSAGLAGVLAVVMVAIVLVWSLRSLRLLVVALVTLTAGLIGTASFAAFAVGHLNLLSVAFAVLYVGLGVDFILHITLRVKELIVTGESLPQSIEGAMRGVGASLVICTVTTAAGFYSFIPTPFDGVSELGLISGTGIFISFLASVTLLPALLAATCTEHSIGPYVRSPRVVAKLSALEPRRVVAATLVLVVAGMLSLPWVYFDSNPVNLRDPDTESVRALDALAERSDADVLTLVAVARGSDEAGIWRSALEQLPEVARITTADALVPGEQASKLEVIDEIGLLLGPGFAEFAPRASDPGELQGALARLEGALRRAGRTAAQSELLAAVENVEPVVGGGGPALVRQIDRDLLSNLPESLEDLETALSARAFTRADLPPELKDRWIDAAGDELIEVVPAEDITDNEAAARFVDAVRGIVPSATGLPIVYHEAARTVVASFRLAMTYAVVLVATLLLLTLRSIVATVFVLVPIAAAAVITAGFTVWFGIPFNFANIIALPLLVGVGVDNAIHMVHRSRTEPPRGGSLIETSTSLAVLASGLTTIASFGNLAFSTHRGMSTMGTLLTIGMIMTMLATLVFLPALLKLRPRARSRERA